MIDEIPPSKPPSWLMGEGAGQGPLPLNQLLSQSVYYPACGFDGDPVRILAGNFYSFVYVDSGVEKDALKARLDEFRGYAVLTSREVREEELVPTGWTPIPPTAADCIHGRALGPKHQPFGVWAILERKNNYGPDHGPERFSLLYIGGDGVATFQALYHGNHAFPAVIGIIQPGTGWGGNWTDFEDQGKILGRSVLDNPAGVPTYMLHGGLGESTFYAESCWPAFRERIWREHRPNRHVSLWQCTSADHNSVPSIPNSNTRSLASRPSVNTNEPIMPRPNRGGFRRHVSSELVHALATNSLWKNICSDRELGPEIRDDHVTVYYMGQALLRELQLRSGSIVASTHHKFIPLQGGGGDYVSMRWEEQTGLEFDSPVSPRALGFGESDNLAAYKRMIRYEAIPEGKVLHKIVTNAENRILDQQIEFTGGIHNKLDLAYFDESIGKLCFGEVKRCTDTRLLAPINEPEVIQQLHAYADWLMHYSDSIAKEYGKVVRAKRALGMGDRIERVPDDLSVLAKPILIIGNCTGADVTRIRKAKLKGDEKWAPLWAHLERVAAGLILCSDGGCNLGIRARGGGQSRLCFG